MKKIAMLLTLLFALCLGMVAEAYNLPMRVTAHKHVTCYSGINGTTRGYIDAGDSVYITKIQGDWAYGSYPVNNGRGKAWRWFKLADVMRQVKDDRVRPINDDTIRPSRQIKGDVNGDGKVNNKDVQLLKNYLTGSSSGTFIKKNADMNGDGKITLTDLSQLKLKVGNTDSSDTGNNDVRPSRQIKGDVNGDGRVNNKDVQLLKNYLTGNSSGMFIKKNADLNGDGKITLTDLSQLKLKVSNPNSNDVRNNQVRRRRDPR